MRKILIVLLALPVLSYASSLDMSTLRCRNMKITSATTLADVQHNCLISEQTSDEGLFEVEFTNDATQKSVTCYFGSNTPTAYVNGCK